MAKRKVHLCRYGSGRTVCGSDRGPADATSLHTVDCSRCIRMAAQQREIRHPDDYGVFAEPTDG